MIGLLPRTCEQIERIAEDTLVRIDRDLLYKPQPLPVDKVMAFMSEAYGVEVGFDRYLDSAGKYEIATKKICIAANVWETSRWRFVLAHEMGHAILHGDVRFEGDEYYEQGEEKKEYDIFTGKRKLKTERDVLEWQASRFAAALTIPRKRFKSKLIEIQEALGISRRGRIYRDGNRYNLVDYRKTMVYLCLTYGVSRMTVLCRLRSLNLINREPRLVGGGWGWLNADEIMAYERSLRRHWLNLNTVCGDMRRFGLL